MHFPPVDHFIYTKKKCILTFHTSKSSRIKFIYLQILSCEFFLALYPESRSGKPATVSKHIFLLIYRKRSNIKIINTPTAERNPTASGETERNGKRRKNTAKTYYKFQNIMCQQ